MAKDKAGVAQNATLKNETELKKALHKNNCNLRRAREKNVTLKRMVHYMENFGAKRAAEWFTEYKFEFEINPDTRSQKPFEHSESGFQKVTDLTEVKKEPIKIDDLAKEVSKHCVMNFAVQYQCLFCDDKYSSVEIAEKHVRNIHFKMI